jgi:DNA-binding MarR family transcriptional regulator
MQRLAPGTAEVCDAVVGDRPGCDGIERLGGHRCLLAAKMLLIKLLVRENTDDDRLTSRHFAWKLQAMAEDAVDKKLKIWADQLPELDLATEGIVGRIQHLEKRLRRSMEETLKEFELDYGQWVVLGALRSAGPPYRRSAGALAQVLDLTSGAMTSRLDRMESAGLVRRLPDPDDRRGVKIEITDKGSQVWEDAVGVQAAKEQMVAGALSPKEKQQLSELLKRLVLAFEATAAARAAASRDAA